MKALEKKKEKSKTDSGSDRTGGFIFYRTINKNIRKYKMPWADEKHEKLVQAILQAREENYLCGKIMDVCFIPDYFQAAPQECRENLQDWEKADCFEIIREAKKLLENYRIILKRDSQTQDGSIFPISMQTSELEAQDDLIQNITKENQELVRKNRELKENVEEFKSLFEEREDQIKYLQEKLNQLKEKITKKSKVIKNQIKTIEEIKNATSSEIFVLRLKNNKLMEENNQFLNRLSEERKIKDDQLKNCYLEKEIQTEQTNILTEGTTEGSRMDSSQNSKNISASLQLTGIKSLLADQKVNF